MYQQTMKTVNDNYNVYENESLEEQVVRLAKSYYFKFNIYNKYFNDDNIDRDTVLDEFIENVVYFIFVRKIIDNYDSSISKFSTYIFNVIQFNENIFIFQIKYDFSLNEAIRYKEMTEEKRYDYLTKLRYCLELDAKVIDEGSNQETKLTIGDIVADNNDAYKEFFDKEERSRKLSQILNYIKKSKKLSEKDKERLYYHINNGYNTRKTIEHFGISRQRLDQITKKFRKMLIHAGIRYDN